MRRRAVWITGIGTATPLGHWLDDVATSVLAGRSATGRSSTSQGDNLVAVRRRPGRSRRRAAGRRSGRVRRLPKLQQMALWSAATALDDAGLRRTCPAAPRRHRPRPGWRMVSPVAGRLAAAGRSDPSSRAETRDARRASCKASWASPARPPRSARPAPARTMPWPWAGNGSGSGLVDICLAGSSEIACPITRANFYNLRALSRNLDDPEHASRPFDGDRDGFVMGEGAASSCSNRPRPPAAAAPAAMPRSPASAHRATRPTWSSPATNPGPAAAAMQAALADAGVEPHEIDYVNAHATSTPVGDRAEARALRLVFGTRHGQRRRSARPRA